MQNEYWSAVFPPMNALGLIYKLEIFGGALFELGIIRGGRLFQDSKNSKR